MTDTKPAWMSRTVWTGFIIALLALLNALGMAPEWLTQPVVEEAVFGVLGILAVVFRIKATKAVEVTVAV